MSYENFMEFQLEYERFKNVMFSKEEFMLFHSLPRIKFNNLLNNKNSKISSSDDEINNLYYETQNPIIKRMNEMNNI